MQLNLNVRGLPPSATVAINELSNELIRQGRRIFKLGLGQSPFPVPEPVVKSLQEHAPLKDYLPTRGLRELREAVADHVRRERGVLASADNVIVGPGSKELMFLLQLAYYGEIIIPTPAWVSYEPQARIIGRHVHLVHTDLQNGWRMTADQLEELCRMDPSRPRILILNNPSNPTGGSYPLDELTALAEVARRYRVVVLSDEIYSLLNHDNEHHSIVPLYPEGSIFSSGLSKWCGAGGWRLGVFLVPDRMRWLLDAMVAVASETFTSTCAPVQAAAVTAFRGGPEIEEYLGRCRTILKELGRELARRLTAVGIHVAPPEGAFYLFPDFSPLRETLRARGIATSDALCRRLLDETGVAVLPGSQFGRPSIELTLRLSYVNFDGAAALAATGGLDPGAPLPPGFVDRYCPETLEAIDRICSWVTDARG
jgi:aspartate aminotransferase